MRVKFEFLQIVLYIPNPKIIAPKTPNGNTTSNLVFRPIPHSTFEDAIESISYSSVFMKYYGTKSIFFPKDASNPKIARNIPKPTPITKIKVPPFPPEEAPGFIQILFCNLPYRFNSTIYEIR